MKDSKIFDLLKFLNFTMLNVNSFNSWILNKTAPYRGSQDTHVVTAIPKENPCSYGRTRACKPTGPFHLNALQKSGAPLTVWNPLKFDFEILSTPATKSGPPVEIHISATAHTHTHIHTLRECDVCI